MVTTAINWDLAFARRAKRMRPSDIREFLKLLDQPGVISFAGGIPDPDLFPVEQISSASRSIMDDPAARAQALQYAVSEGYAPLRDWLVGYMASRGVMCERDNIVITSGSQQGLDLLGKLFLSPGDTILVTAPTYLGALQCMEVYEPQYAVIDPDVTSVAAGELAKLAYVVPDFANPTGATLDNAARERMLDIVTAHDVPLIEDAAYEALRFEGERPASMLALDIARCGEIDRSRVIYCGTFSKTISPGLRVGWICAARLVVQKVVLARQAADLHGSNLDQMIIQRVAAEMFDEQVRRILPVYARRRDAMLSALERFMPAGVTWIRPAGGMFIWLTLPETLDSRELLRTSLESEGIIFVPGSSFFTNGDGARNIRLNYTKSSEATIEDGMRRLGNLIACQLAEVAPTGSASPVA
jgi:DNA-binding transcriptional MocR family regulator